jgi:hypothetical protein
VECVRRTRFDSRKVSAGGTLLGDLAEVARRGGKIRLLWGERAALLARHPAARDLIVALTREETRPA